MLVSTLSNVFLVARLLQVAAVQQPFHVNPTAYTSKFSTYDSGLISPVEDLGALSAAEYTTLLHPAYPHHSVRIKQTTDGFCDNTVRSYTGYLSYQARHLFFYFFESRNDPKSDDLILWTNGGPGCSSSLGLLMELGPCTIKDANSTTFNPYSWNTNANIILIDQPVGVGWSYAEYGQNIGTTEDAAKDIAAFVRIFFDSFTEFKGRAFHIAGESYGGRYVPVFAAQVYDENKHAVAAGATPINLVSIMIGNGITDSARTLLSYYDLQCTGASIAPLQDISTCVRMKKALPRCHRLLQESCVDEFDAMNCNGAVMFCESEIVGPFMMAGKNPYDVSKDCSPVELSESLCYAEIADIVNYMNTPVMRTMLGVDPSVGDFTACSPRVSSLFYENMDKYTHQTQNYVAELLERGVRALVYAGTLDWICNWVANDRFTLAMEWSGQGKFASQKLREWSVDGKRVGLTRAAEGLAFVTIEGAGHMVPHDKPAEALVLLKRWLAQEDF